MQLLLPSPVPNLHISHEHIGFIPATKKKYFNLSSFSLSFHSSLLLKTQTTEWTLAPAIDQSGNKKRRRLTREVQTADNVLSRRLIPHTRYFSVIKLLNIPARGALDVAKAFVMQNEIARSFNMDCRESCTATSSNVKWFPAYEFTSREKSCAHTFSLITRLCAMNQLAILESGGVYNR